ncbi:MAG TPA: FRG domain-containing protein [Acidobacteriota bacterium]|nr:FRG domain-containing protein [Acidobacteriota bacterium]
MKELTKQERRRLSRCPVGCQRITKKVENLADYISLIGAHLKAGKPFWFRGHRDVRWTLTPYALRPESVQLRDSGLRLLREFKRIAEIKVDRPPESTGQELKWMQLAQHYGIPTRLLDWTESATFALFFACETSSARDQDGIVFLLNPEDLISLKVRRHHTHGEQLITSLDAHLDETLIQDYFELGGALDRGKQALPTIAIRPVWNSERLMMQRGVFTLHGSRQFELDESQAPSLVGIPILRDVKAGLQRELERIGVDEMTLFPELEHACRHLKRREGLE